MSPIDQLKAVLCDPSGKCCITGSDEDRAIVDRALQALAAARELRGMTPVAWLVSDAQGRYATIRDPSLYAEEVYEPLYALGDEK